MSITLLVLSLSMVMMLLMGSCYGRLTGSQENVYLYTLLKERNDEDSDKISFGLFCDANSGCIVGDAFRHAFYSYAVSGTIDAASVIALAPSMLLGFVGRGGYLWKKGYLKDDGRIWSPVSVAYLGWSIIIGLSTIFPDRLL